MGDALPSFDSLVQDLEHPNPNIRDEACVLLAEHWPDQAMPYFFSRLHDPDPVVYRTAVKALGTLGHRTLPDLLELFQSSGNGTVKACCVKAIVQISVNFPNVAFPVEVLSMLEQALDDSSPVVAQSSLMTLGYLSKHDSEKDRVIPLLIQACDRANIAHVQGSAMALAELDSPLVSPFLEKLAKDGTKDPLIREVAQSSLERRASLNLK